MIEEIRNTIKEKSGIDHKETPTDFISSDFFLHILGKSREELPKDHYILPYLQEGDRSLGEIHFLPNGNATSNTANLTEILLIGIMAIREYAKAIEDGTATKHNRIYGRSDSEMARVAQTIGFTSHVSKDEGSKIISATPDEIIKGVKELEKRVPPETLEKMKARVARKTAKE